VPCDSVGMESSGHCRRSLKDDDLPRHCHERSWVSYVLLATVSNQVLWRSLPMPEGVFHTRSRY
jgi:hypothetical protein